MPDFSQHVQYGATPAVTKRVFMTYTAAVSAGYPVCYDYSSVNTYQNVTDAAIGLSTPAESRRLVVDKPDLGNNQHFAGVIARDYAANIAGQWVEIFPPGEICDIKIASTVDATQLVTALPYRNTGQLLTFGVGKWYFKKSGFPGRGSATTLQMITGSNKCRVHLQDGLESGGYQELVCYTGTVSLLISIVNGITRGGVTEILSAVDGVNTTKAAITTRYVLTDGDYIGQHKLILHNTTVGITVFEMFVCIPKATQHVTTGVATVQLEDDLPSAVGSIMFSNTLAETSPSYLDAVWNGAAWDIRSTASGVS